MATQAGTDTQNNLFSITSGGCGIGIGGPNPIALPLSSIPSDGIYDPSNTGCQLAALLGANPRTPGSYDAILKVSNGAGPLALMNVQVSQGYQDAANLNVGVSNVSIQGDFAINGAPGLRVITIKGGCSNIRIAGTIHQHGTSEDVKIDDWSDQSYAHSTGIDLSGLKMADGSPVKIVARYGSVITAFPASYSISFVDNLGLTAYWDVKRVVRLIPLLNGTLGVIPLGASGPVWLP